MLDIQKLRDEHEVQLITSSLAKRLGEHEAERRVSAVLKADAHVRRLIADVDALKAERNAHSKTKPTPEVIEKMKEVGDKIKNLDTQLSEAERDYIAAMSELPNIVADDVVAGGKENNSVIATYGKKQTFDFEPQDHVALATSLGLIDYERAAKMSGAGFWIYTGKGALLEWALLNYFIDYHRKNHYTFLIPPFLLNEDSAYTSGHLPKFRDDLFWTQDGTCLNATSEMMLGNLHRDEILDVSTLPLKYFAYSTCFRREAGSYRKEERGMIRGHQFNKIEMFQFTKQENSWDGFAELVSHAQRLVEGLDLHYQSSLLAAGDASAAMAKTIDIEVWIPSMGIYKEVSSVSNALEYQARRGKIRYKDPETGKNLFAHTLNASGLATSRLIPALLEQHQQSDGSVKIPKALQPYCGFEIISK